MSKPLDEFEESCLEKALGFKLPNNNLKKMIQNLSNEKIKSKIFAQLENYQKFDVSEFEKNIVKFHKPNAHNKLKLDQNKEKNSKTIFSEALNLAELSPTEKAYYLAYKPESTILSDLEANKLKSISPQIIAKANPLEDHNHEYGVLDLNPLNNNENNKVSGEIFYEGEENPNNPNTIQTSYCICKKPYKEGELMISCDYDQCGGWFHVECVGFGGKTEEEITKIKWYCSEECKEKANRASVLNYKAIKKKTKGK